VIGGGLPWHEEQWRQLARLRGEQRMPHAILLAAPAGTGVGMFADRWAGALLCTAAASTEAGACGQCSACEQLAAGTHPDMVRLLPEEAGKAIGVDTVRALIDRLELTAGAGGKVALIDPADAMTLAAANSLLKTLEEPPGECVILLVSRRPSRLPATVRSRCRELAFGLPSAEAALAWLREHGVDRPEYWFGRAGGAPLEAARLADSDAQAHGEVLLGGLLDTLERGTVSPRLVAQAADMPLESSLPLFTSVIADLLRLRVAGTEAGRLQHPAHAERMQRVAGRLDARALFHYLDELNHAAPGPSSSLRIDMQIQGLLADAAAIGRSERGPGGR